MTGRLMLKKPWAKRPKRIPIFREKVAQSALEVKKGGLQ